MLSAVKIQAITERTDREWPADHPLRAQSAVVSNADIVKAEFLICSVAGSERLPPAEGDHDEVCACSAPFCGRELVRRASSPRHLKPICAPCWEAV